MGGSAAVLIRSELIQSQLISQLAYSQDVMIRYLGNPCMGSHGYLSSHGGSDGVLPPSELTTSRCCCLACWLPNCCQQLPTQHVCDTATAAVGLAWLGAALFGQGFWFFSPGVGFSGVVYALRVVASHSKDGGAERHGWGKLLYTSQVQAANVGFLAHLSGVLTGQVRLHLVPPGESVAGMHGLPASCCPSIC